MPENMTEDLYETRTNLLSCDNLIDYFWRRCARNSYPFKPDNSMDILTKAVSEDHLTGKDIFSSYTMASKDIHNSGIKKGGEYRFDLCDFKTTDFDKNEVSHGRLALVYKTDRKIYDLFLVLDPEDTQPGLKLLMSVKQKTGLFGSFQTEAVNYF